MRIPSGSTPGSLLVGHASNNLKRKHLWGAPGARTTSSCSFYGCKPMPHTQDAGSLPCRGIMSTTCISKLKCCNFSNISSFRLNYEQLSGKYCSCRPPSCDSKSEISDSLVRRTSNVSTDSWQSSCKTSITGSYII